MLPDMATTSSPAHEADRAAAAPFVEQPRSAWWYAPATAVFFTAMAAGPALAASGHAPLGFSIQGAALLGFLVFNHDHRRRAGTSPRMRSAPHEITVAYVFLAVGGTVAATVTAMSWLTWGAQAGLAVLFLASLGVVWTYERLVYPRAVRLVRQRLA